MKHFFKKRRLPPQLFRAIKIGAIASLFLILVSVASAFSYGLWVAQEITNRFEQLRGNRPSQIYAASPSFRAGQMFRVDEFENTLQDYGYQPASTEGCVGCYRISPGELWLSRDEFALPGKTLTKEVFRITWEDADGVREFKSFQQENSEAEIEEIAHAPQRIGVFSAGRVRTQDFVPLEQIPVALRLAVMGIEDDQFLEHRGVSIRAILRAVWKDLMAGRFAQGGSTITQQLMKNLFFSREKVMTRKFKEVFYALIAESGHSKEAILEAYLNEVYLGQVSSHEIHGVNEAARFYFNRAATEVTLAQSATLAAMIQAPNVLDPRRNSERVRQRRDLVLKKMLEAQFILKEEYDSAIKEPLGAVGIVNFVEDIDYFLELVWSELPESIRASIDTSAHSIYLNIRPRLQKVASETLRSQLLLLEKRIATLRKKEAPLVSLEGALIAVDVKECRILASQGGRSFRSSPFNRIRHGHRQSGSLIKPFVYLTGLLTDEIAPDAILSDTPFEWAYDRQVWKPKNYDELFRGDVTAAEALEQSLNVPTARLAQQVGIDRIVETLKLAGIESELFAVPSLSLGSAELTPLEIAGAYATLARMGKACALSSVDSVFDENGNELYRRNLAEEEVFPKAEVLTLLQMLAGVMTRGTAKLALAQLGREAEFFAGKTGTTSDYRDAWFVGFSPDLLVLTWVGYDEKESVGLTGASAALPIWIKYVQSAKRLTLPRGFLIQPGE